MTCDQALDIADGEGLVDVRAETLDAARAHARQCERCREAFAAAGALAGFTALAHPELPRDFSANIMGRVQAVADARHSAASPVEYARPTGAWRDGVGIAAVAAGLSIAIYIGARQTWMPSQVTLVRDTSVLLSGPFQVPLALVPILLVLLVLVSLGMPRDASTPRQG
jgi:hypothetical protein